MKRLTYVAQTELLHAILEHREVCLELSGRLFAHHFENKAVGQVAQTALELFVRYGYPPTEGQVREVIKTFQGSLAMTASAALSDAIVAQVPPATWAIEQGVHLAASSELRGLSALASEFAARGDFDGFVAAARDVAALASPRGETTHGLGDPSTRHGIEVKAIPTLIEGLDRWLPGGGLPLGQYSIGVALKGGGKSHALVHFGAAARRGGYQVAHVTAEMSRFEVMQRYDRNFSGLAEEEFLAGYLQQMDKMKYLSEGLTIIEATKRPISVAGIEAALDRLPEARQPQLVLIDYLQLLALTGIGGNDPTAARRQGLADVSMALHIMAQERGAHVATVYQANRAAYFTQMEEDAYIEPQHISESIGVHYPAEIVYSLNQTMAEAVERQGRIFLAENRGGEKRKPIYCQFRWDISTITGMAPGYRLEDTSG